MARTVNVLALVKDGQRYVFLFDESSHDELLRQIGETAADEELNFTWYDAAVLSQRVREMQEEAETNQFELDWSDAFTTPNRLPELDW